MTDFVDMYSGVGGWELAARELGLAGVGFEWWDVASATATAAGHVSVIADVRSDFARLHPATREARGLVASPPCQTFSAAGKGAGRAELDRILALIAAGVAEDDSLWEDERTALALEPLRWIMTRIEADDPFDWIAMEEVPACLPVWEAYGALLAGLGYSTHAQIVHTEQHGTPQTRTRAILMASRLHEVGQLTPRHSKFYVADPARLDEGLAPWVPMSSVIPGEYEITSPYSTGGDRNNKGRRRSDQPSFTVTSKINRTWLRSADGDRKLTTEEAALLQTFPANYPWQGGSSDRALQAGNAIPPVVAQAVLEMVR